MDNKEALTFLADVMSRLNSTNSSKMKLDILTSVYDTTGPKEQEWLNWALVQTYSPYITFGVTSESIKKWMNNIVLPDMFAEIIPIDILLQKLDSRELTGNRALQVISDNLMYLPKECREVVYNIIDKNLKIRMDAKSINKVIHNLIPVFEVSLCNVYTDRKHKVNFEKDKWFASRKLDGVRCLTVIDDYGDIKCFSRQGKEFNTLQVLKHQLQISGFRNLVFDGEMCIVDANGDEDFKSITKEVTRKDHTIKNPRYKVFDMMTLEEFESRTTNRNFSRRLDALDTAYAEYKNIMTSSGIIPCMEMVEMVPVKNLDHFNQLFNRAKAKDWEGLVIRKDDNVICKRSDSMLKVKDFADAEYVVEDIEVGPFRVIKDGKEVEEEVMTNAYITHKGNRVSVGSGWSLEQRRRYKDNPGELIGKTITVQYFEETKDKDGNISLRFPTCKMVYENGRDM